MRLLITQNEIFGQVIATTPIEEFTAEFVKNWWQGPLPASFPTDTMAVLALMTMIVEPLVQSSTTNGKGKTLRSCKMHRAAALAEEAEEPSPLAALPPDTSMDIKGSFMNTEPAATENNAEA
ncbi:hypothetical protein PUNSTDRAFT_47177 [Punctularia strigosozonata HHB-11173 SS5]|uniref:Uncharacterized protein n=1 Tax=Punctularia strigosozonata (strain HHB-11173) TaxID=741275 RepID=R7S506_PUNST|nr:uncharacterized protein PUNSTDRAFT_47177 [Punctularia strigosozonata HHB-11173 SS5]EIN04917.1 hypothetical protein PUNSTDRAFT_47177 [Punctularia strigosozonata HHB-11173 SS5]